MAFGSQSPLHLLARLTVKVRILTLSLFTIVGLLAIGAVFFWSQGELNSAFTRMNDSSTLAEQVAELSEAASALRTIEKQYLSAPSSERYQAFGATLEQASAAVSKLVANGAATDHAARV
ncbi:MAG: methyl-accepting chemotaxis protein, partial [Roseibium sp.]|nr:methyl-accepting chemotaxis protein [Roseibium sp.]